MRAYAARQPRWTREALDAFIADPQAVVPDNEMGFFGIADAEERRALIEYLAALLAQVLGEERRGAAVGELARPLRCAAAPISVAKP